MNRTKIINYLIEKNNYQTYLEVGCQLNVNFDAIKISHKEGVDPVSGGTYRMTSDEYFSQNKNEYKKTFDIILIDGLHQATQVYRDINNSLDILNDNGTIVCHDMIPASYEAQVLPRVSKHWNGDCWMAWVWLRATRLDLEMRVLDRVDCGTAIIRKGFQELLLLDKNITYENMDANKKEWLNTIKEEEFKLIY